MKRILSKLFQLIKSGQYELFLGSCIVLVAVISYNLGQINSLKKSPIAVQEHNNQKAEIFDAVSSSTGSKSQDTKYEIQNAKLDRRVVGSKNSDKYHFTWCSGTKRIKEENKVWFADEKAAKAAGYTLAGNCQ